MQRKVNRNMIPGNPQIVATNGRYNVIKRGSRYAVLKDGEPLDTVKSWGSRSILSSKLVKGGYDEVDPPKPYKEG